MGVQHRSGWRRTWSHTDRKPCSKCGVVKPLGEFDPHPDGFLARQSVCKPCWQVAYGPAEELSRIRREFGEDALAILTRILAGEGCDACGRVLDRRNMHIDHDHTTNRVRGLLCINCNAALGNVNDSIERLEALIAYLQNIRR